ncbi:MAG: hypothetical protein RL744_1477 [Pseudomonadota bacterium]
MNKFSKLMVLAMACFSPFIFAQSGFQGFYGQIATGYENNSVSNTSLTMNNSSNFPGGNNPSKGSMPLVIGLGYNYAVTPEFILGLGVDYSLLQTTIGNANINPSVQPNTGTTYKVSNRLNLFVTPGYAIDKDKLVYAKAGYSTQRLQTSYWDNIDGQCSGNSTGSGNVNGYVLGAGYKQMIAGGFYGFGEANYYKYGNASFGNSSLCDTTLITNFQPSTSAYNFLVGIGYKF